MPPKAYYRSWGVYTGRSRVVVKNGRKENFYFVNWNYKSQYIGDRDPGIWIGEWMSGVKNV